MAAAVVQRTVAQTQVRQQILENKKKQKKKRKFFVPVHETTTKASKKRKESLNSALESIQEYLKDRPAHELLSLLKEDSERQ